MKMVQPFKTTNCILREPTESRVDGLVQKILTMFGAAFKGLKHANISHLEDMPSSVKELWCSSMTSSPLLFKSSRCWQDRPPSVRGLVLDTLNSLQNHGSSSLSESECSFRINYRGEVNTSVSPAMAIAQFLDPDPVDPIFITGLRMPVVNGIGYRAPYELSTIVEPFEESNIQVNLTPKYSFVDLHIGTSLVIFL
jgi:hypothetical protein